MIPSLSVVNDAPPSVVVYTPPTVGRIPLVETIGKSKLVPLDSGIIMTARNLGISLGD